MCVAAFLILITEVLCRVSVDRQTKRRSCFTTFTQRSQLIFSLAGILKQRFELQFVRLADISQFASRCCLADAQHTCQMKPSDVSVAIILFVLKCNYTHMNVHRNTLSGRDLPTNLHLPGSNCFHVAL